MAKARHTKAVREAWKRQIRFQKHVRGEVTKFERRGDLAILHFADGRFAILMAETGWEGNNGVSLFGATATADLLLAFDIISSDEYDAERQLELDERGELGKELDTRTLRRLVEKYPYLASEFLGRIEDSELSS